MKRTSLWFGLAFATFALSGCHLDMWIQPKVKAQSENDFYADGRGTRMPVEGTVEFGKPKLDEAFYTGYENGKMVKEMPVPVTADLIKRGKDRYDIFCSHCHGAIGDGKGMIAQRGFEMQRPIGNYHTDRLREMPVGHFYDVITNGYGTMYPQGPRIKPADRWAIVSYIRALQLSQYAPFGALNNEQRGQLGVNFAEPMPNGPLFPAKGQTVVPSIEAPAPTEAAPPVESTPAEPAHAEGGAH
ncbi:MAG: cytochrome c [Fimbriimonadaceae bacterium]